MSTLMHTHTCTWHTDFTHTLKQLQCHVCIELSMQSFMRSTTLPSLYIMLIGTQVSHCGCPCGDHQPWGRDPGESRVCGKATDKDVSEE